MNMNALQFTEARESSEKPFLVEFMAPWCTYCRRIAPAMELIAKEQGETLTVGFINIDEEPELANQEKIELVPTLVIYRDGKELGSIVAPDSKAKIDQFIRESLEK